MAAAEDVLDDAVARAVAGDEDAFAAIYRELQPRLVRYLRLQHPGYGDDAASETWLEVARHLPGFEGGGAQLRSWVFTIARNKVIDHVRYEKRRPVAYSADIAELSPAADTDVATQVVDASAAEELMRLVAGLPSHEAEIVTLRVVAGLDVPTVAQLTGRKPGAVRVAAHRGLRRLAQRLEALPAPTDDAADAAGRTEGTAPPVGGG